jgi:Spy/CpxP family protein refolding chaperone
VTRAKWVLAMLVGLAVGQPAPAAAQEKPQQAVADDPLFETLYAPELIMQHRRAIGLTDQQRDAISKMIGDLQGRVVSLQWELLDEVQQLKAATSGTRVDLDRSLDHLGHVLETEGKIKRAHLEMLVRIKNLLTPQQQATLDRLRGEAGAPPGG